MSTPTITKATFDTFQIVKDADADGTIQRDVFPGKCRLHHVSLDNAANGAASYLKLYDDLNPVVGTTSPDEILRARASVKEEFPINPNVENPGLVFENGLSFACVTAGGTAGTTSPTSNVVVVLTVSKES